LLSAEKGDVDFDELQNNALDVGTPVAILHQSQDGQRFYARAEASSGWVKKDLIALSGREEIRAREGADSFIIVTSPKADIYQDEALTENYDYAQMGTRFPTKGESSLDAVKVRLMTRGDDGRAIAGIGYLKKEDVREGYLAYTPRHIFEQAFKLLNAPYGWGGMYGEQDCSRFVQQVFATVGIKLPRNSSEQANSGTVIAKFDEKTEGRDKKEVLITKAVPGTTLLGMSGHIMLYLGNVDGRPYAIHATWAFRENQDGQEIRKVINKVVVSDLSLGDGSARGSLLKRLRTITAVSR